MDDRAKFVWVPPANMTPEDRKFIGAHERLHLDFMVISCKKRGQDLSPEDLGRRLAAIALFEKGMTDSPFPGVSAKQWPPAVDVFLSQVFAPPAPPKKYFVHWGWMHNRTDEFTDFTRALSFYADHKGGPCGARLLGEGADADHDGDGFREVSDGLTDEERAKVEMYG